MISKLLNSQPAKKWFVMARSAYRAMKVLSAKEFLSRVYLNLRKNIYPINIPQIKVRPNLDFLVMELPPRYQPFMPNGVGYVYNILEKSGIRFQVIDANIIFYHRFHSRRILEGVDSVVTQEGYVMKSDPWVPENAAE